MHVTAFGQLPAALRIAIVALVVVQLGLQVWGLIDLATRKRVLGDRKWLWLILIVFGELVGVIVYLAIGRNVPAEAADPLHAQDVPASEDRVEHAADVLYGKR
jgi:hypothetical protein